MTFIKYPGKAVNGQPPKLKPSATGTLESFDL